MLSVPARSADLATKLEGAPRAEKRYLTKVKPCNCPQDAGAKQYTTRLEVERLPLSRVIRLVVDFVI